MILVLSQNQLIWERKQSKTWLKQTMIKLKKKYKQIKIAKPLTVLQVLDYPEDFFKKADSKEETEGTDGGGGAFGTLPVESDFMLAYATVPGESKKQLYVLMCLAFYPKEDKIEALELLYIASSCRADKGSNRSLEKKQDLCLSSLRPLMYSYLSSSPHSLLIAYIN